MKDRAQEAIKMPFSQGKFSIKGTFIKIHNDYLKKVKIRKEENKIYRENEEKAEQEKVAMYDRLADLIYEKIENGDINKIKCSSQIESYDKYEYNKIIKISNIYSTITPICNLYINDTEIFCSKSKFNKILDLFEQKYKESINTKNIEQELMLSLEKL